MKKTKNENKDNKPHSYRVQEKVLAQNKKAKK